MFPSKVARYNDDDLIGTDATTADDNFDTAHPLYQHIADLAALREDHPALADGAQIHRYASSGPGIYAFSRIDAGRAGRVRRRRSTTPTTAQTATFDTYQPAAQHAHGGLAGRRRRAPQDRRRGPRHRDGPAAVGGRLQGDREAAGATERAPMPSFTAPGDGGIVSGRAGSASTVPGGDSTR